MLVFDPVAKIGPDPIRNGAVVDAPLIQKIQLISRGRESTPCIDIPYKVTYWLHADIPGLDS
jgi:hypothetical protein